MIVDPWFYAAAVPAMLLLGVSKGGFGTGLGILAVPLMSLVISPAQAAGITLPLLVLMDLVGVVNYRRTWDRTQMRILLPAALVGIGIGTATFHVLSEDALRLIIGAVAVSFTLHYWLRPGARSRQRPTSVLRGSFWGAVSGFTSFVAHAGGPPVSVYLLPLRLEKTVFTSTAVVFFTVVNYVKLIPYAWLGQLEPGNLSTALVLSPLAPLGMWLGIRLHHRLPPDLFYRIVYAMVLLAGLKLLYEGLDVGTWVLG